MFNLIAVIRNFHEFGNSPSVVRDKETRGASTTVDMHRLKSRFRQLALAMDFEVIELDETGRRNNVVYPRFGGGDDNRPGAA